MLKHIAPALAPGPDDEYLRSEIGALNSQRINRLLLIVLLVHLAHVVLFWPYTPGASSKTHLWRNGVIVAHTAMAAVLMVVFFPVKKVMERKKRLSSVHLSVMSGFVSLLYLSLGAALVIIDQLVTATITPLLVASTGVAVTIVVRPVVAAINYALVLAVSFVGVSWTQPSSDLLLTVRVNSITATGLGFGLALLQWRNQTLAIRQQRRIADQQRELEETNRKLTLLATRDALTGLLNRAQFMLDANREVARMRRAGTRGCLVMLDVDYFKQVNDTYGHPTGDSILVQVARVLPRVLRGSDLLARFGGEEFAVLLPDTPLPEGVHVAERLRAAIEAEPFLIGGRSVTLTASFGVAELVADDPDALERCYHAADKALYQAKEDGRNCVRCIQQGHGARLDLRSC